MLHHLTLQVTLIAGLLSLALLRALALKKAALRPAPLLRGSTH